MKKKLIILGFLSIILTNASMGGRVKDLGTFSGTESVRLLGYGLVVGLEGSGDSQKSIYTNQSLTNMLERFGISVDGGKVKSKNVAAVMVTAELQQFQRNGSRFDIIVSSLGDSKSLQGGILLQTSLIDAHGEFWGLGAGPISIGGFNIEAGNVSVRQNHSVVGRIPEGGMLRRENSGGFQDTTKLFFQLRNGDFTSANRLVDAVNFFYKDTIASAIDAINIEIDVPTNYANSKNIVTFIAELENISFEPDIQARIVINERTGTIIIGSLVNISTVAISHGSLSITIKSTPIISQPQPFGKGETRVEQFQEVTVEEGGTGIVVIPGTSSVQDVATALNKLGVTPRDIIAIFQALNRSGALQGELVII